MHHLGPGHFPQHCPRLLQVCWFIPEGVGQMVVNTSSCFAVPNILFLCICAGSPQDSVMLHNNLKCLTLTQTHGRMYMLLKLLCLMLPSIWILLVLFLLTFITVWKWKTFFFYCNQCHLVLISSEKIMKKNHTASKWLYSSAKWFICMGLRPL